MPRLFASPGIADVAVKNVTAFVAYEFLTLLVGGHVARLHDTGRVLREEANQWWTSLAAAERDGTFLYGFTAFIVSGTKIRWCQVAIRRQGFAGGCLTGLSDCG
jgi:hypothetical protein